MGSERVRRHPHPALDPQLVRLLLRSRRLMGPGPQPHALKAPADRAAICYLSSSRLSPSERAHIDDLLELRQKLGMVEGEVFNDPGVVEQRT